MCAEWIFLIISAIQCEQRIEFSKNPLEAMLFSLNSKRTLNDFVFHNDIIHKHSRFWSDNNETRVIINTLLCGMTRH